MKIKTLQEFTSDLMLDETTTSILNEDVNIDILVDDDADTIINSIKEIDGVKSAKPTKFGVIKAIVSKKIISILKKLSGVEDVQEIKD